ncbi:Detected protein of unknown function [Hibiscus syriacus]|uniref:Uncharacterized protein n=1 Tax=Hibiscus syriacus TaxID=106335 RepID=A0A6A3CRA6_HIBSY|nr:uncharacterized protein LOC120176950 [Hibiscus syriacus]KAE8729659.1 Detected protein of unknown function [Hibiscus syriacus]
MKYVLVHPHRVGYERSFYNEFFLSGLRVDRVKLGFVSCTFKVPPRLILSYYNPTGLSSFTLVNLFVREFGYTAFNTIGGHLQDELEITLNALGQRGGYDGTIVLVRNKATGELIAEVQNADGGFATYELTRSYQWMEETA